MDLGVLKYSWRKKKKTLSKETKPLCPSPDTSIFLEVIPFLGLLGGQAVSTELHRGHGPGSDASGSIKRDFPWSLLQTDSSQERSESGSVSFPGRQFVSQL